MALSFPRHVHARGGVYFVVSDADAYVQAIADGWQDQPPAAAAVYREWLPTCDWSPSLTSPVQLPSSSASQSAAPLVSLPSATDTLAKRGPGRPKKSTPVPNAD